MATCLSRRLQVVAQVARVNAAALAGGARSCCAGSVEMETARLRIILPSGGTNKEPDIAV